MKGYIALLALSVSGVALAQEALPPFEEVDSNQDGQVSRTEAAAIEGLDFTTADTNQDGSLDRTEYMASAQQGGQGSQGQGQGQGQGSQSPGSPGSQGSQGSQSQGVQ